jgi:hypothetical protein
MDVLLRRFLRAGVRRGLAGNWYWFLLAGATFLLRRVLNERTGVVSSVTVAPGEQVLITVRDRTTPAATAATPAGPAASAALAPVDA